MSESMISNANLHHLSADEVSLHVVKSTTWVNLGPVAVFGQGADTNESLNHLREIFHKALTDIDLKIEEGSLDPANDTALPPE